LGSVQGEITEHDVVVFALDARLLCQGRSTGTPPLKSGVFTDGEIVLTILKGNGG
jgi:hypothetical protein